MSTSSAERRTHPRHPVHLAATLVDDDGLARHDVIVRNVSAAGAMLEFGAPTHLSREFYLLMPGHAIQPCRLCWQSGTLAGVSYVEA
jgi:PilZ domain.